MIVHNCGKNDQNDSTKPINDYKGEDVTHFANLDCQTPYYFVYLENGTYNKSFIALITLSFFSGWT